MILRSELVGAPIEERFSHDAAQNLLFVNLERFQLQSEYDIAAIRENVEAKLAPVGHRVYAIVNYDNFTLLPELLHDYSAMVRTPVDRSYSAVSRYSTSGFLRGKLGDSLERRRLAPHIFENAAEARSLAPSGAIERSNTSIA